MTTLSDLSVRGAEQFLWDSRKHPRSRGKFAPISNAEADGVGEQIHADASSALKRSGSDGQGSHQVKHNRDGTHTISIDHGNTSHRVTIGHNDTGEKIAHVHQNEAERSGDLDPDPAHRQHRSAIGYALRRQGYKVVGSSAIHASAERFDMTMPNPPSNVIGDTALIDVDPAPDPDENPGALAQAVDAVLDAIEQQFAGVDLLSLPPVIQQAIALVTAADTTVDQLLKVLQMPDPDDLDAGLDGDDNGIDPDGLGPDNMDADNADQQEAALQFQAKTFQLMRDLATYRLRHAQFAFGGNDSLVQVPSQLAPKTNDSANPEVGGDPEKLAGQLSAELDQLAAGSEAGTSRQLDTARGIATQITDSLGNGDNDGAVDYASGLQEAIGAIDGSTLGDKSQSLAEIVELADQLVTALNSVQQAQQASPAVPAGPGAAAPGAKPKPFTATERALYDSGLEEFSVEMFAGPGNDAKPHRGAQPLIDWFNRGADGAIHWGKPGDFMECVAVASKHMEPDKAKGFCNNRHQDNNHGEAAGVDAHGGRHAHSGRRKVFADTSAKGRRKAAASGAAMKDGSFPINTAADIPRAVRALGRTDESRRPAVKAHIKRRAKSLGAQHLVPDSWKPKYAAAGRVEYFANPDQQAANRQAADNQRKAQKQAQAKQAQGQSGFDESKHPRGAAGGATGGQFIAAGSGGTSSSSDEQAQVLGVQQALGLDPTGAISPSDVDAIKKFQQENGLAVDGLVGSQTADALREKVGGGDPKNAASESVGALGDKDKQFLAGNDPVWNSHPASGPGNPFGSTKNHIGGLQADGAVAPEAGQIQAVGRNFKIPVGIIEGVPTGDKRKIAPEALSWRQPPLPVMAITKTTEGHKEAELVGHVLELTRQDASQMTNPKTSEPYGEGTYVISGQGKFMNDEYADKIGEMIREKFLTGVSADLSDVSSEFEADPSEEFGDDGEGEGGEVDLISLLTGQGVNGNEVVTSGRIMGFTICPFPAFEGAYLEMDDGDAQIDSKPVALSASAEQWPAFTVHDEFGARVCEPCQQGLVASAGAGPMYPPKAWFQNPNLGKVTPLTITDDGRVFGHLAPWNQCHTGASGQCVIAPRSRMDYAMYHKGSLKTAEGEIISTGLITMDTGHASEMLSMAPALEHYDNTGSQVADVCMGEDKHGVWFSGAVRPDVDELKLRRLRASGLSGDWRLHGGNLELMAALAVNVEGFPKPRARVASGAIQALTAAGGREVIRYALADKSTEELELQSARRSAALEVGGEGPTYTDLWVARLVAERVGALRASIIGPRLESLRASVVAPAMERRAAELRGQVVRPKATDLLTELRVRSLRASMGLDTEANALVSSEYALWDSKKHPRDRGKFAPGDHVEVNSPGHGYHGVRGTVVRHEGEHTVVKSHRGDELRVHTNRLRPVSSMAAASYDEKMHPRGHDGKWIHPGDTVQVKGGGEAKVVGIASDGDLRVKTTGGESLKIKPDTVSGGSNETPSGGATPRIDSPKGAGPRDLTVRDVPGDSEHVKAGEIPPETPIVHPDTGKVVPVNSLEAQPTDRVTKAPTGSKVGDAFDPATGQELPPDGASIPGNSKPNAADVGAAGSDTHIQTDGGGAVHKADAAAKMYGAGSKQHKAAIAKHGQGTIPAVGPRPGRIPTSGVVTPNDTTPEQRNNGGRNLTDEELKGRNAPSSGSAADTVPLSELGDDELGLHPYSGKPTTGKMLRGQLHPSTHNQPITRAPSSATPEVEANGVTGPVGNLNPRPVLPEGWKPPTSGGPSGPSPVHPHNLGDQVSHPTYGTGTVTGIDPYSPAGPRSIVQWDHPHPEVGPTGRSSERSGDLTKVDNAVGGGEIPSLADPQTGQIDMTNPKLNAAGDEVVGHLNDMVNGGDLDEMPNDTADMHDSGVDPALINDTAAKHGLNPGDLANHLDNRLGSIATENPTKLSPLPGDVAGDGGTPDVGEGLSSVGDDPNYGPNGGYDPSLGGPDPSELPAGPTTIDLSPDEKQALNYLNSDLGEVYGSSNEGDSEDAGRDLPTTSSQAHDAMVNLRDGKPLTPHQHEALAYMADDGAGVYADGETAEEQELAGALASVVQKLNAARGAGQSAGSADIAGK